MLKEDRGAAEHRQQNQLTKKEKQEKKDPNFERKLELVTAGLQPFVKEHLLTKVSRENCKSIIDYMLAL